MVYFYAFVIAKLVMFCQLEKSYSKFWVELCYLLIITDKLRMYNLLNWIAGWVSHFISAIHFWSFTFFLGHQKVFTLFHFLRLVSKRPFHNLLNLLPFDVLFSDFFLSEHSEYIQSSLWSLCVFWKCWLFIYHSNLICSRYGEAVGTISLHLIQSSLKLTLPKWTLIALFLQGIIW